MGYIMGQCPHCSNVMSMPDDSEIVRCPTCKSEVVMAEAAALAGNAALVPAPAQGQGQTSGTQAPPPSPYGQDGPAPYDAASGPAGAQNAPFLASWETNVLFTVLGIVAAGALSILSNSPTDMPPTAVDALVTVIGLAYVAYGFVHALLIYPRCFSDRPVVKSNEAMSFLNGLAGGIIFGLLWNHNLTLKDKGISYIVFVVLVSCSIVLGMAIACAGIAYLVS